MELELYKKIKKGNGEAFKELKESSLKKAWFISWYCTLDSSRAVPLLQNCWGAAINKIASQKSVPKESFISIFSEEILKSYKLEIFTDDTFATAEKPNVGDRFSFLADGLEGMDEELRAVWLVKSFGDLNTVSLGQALGIEPDEAKKLANKASAKWIESSKHIRKTEGRKFVQISNEFTNCDGSGLNRIKIPDIVLNAVEHEHMKSVRTNTAAVKTKEKKPMENQRVSLKQKRKKVKIIVTIAVLVVVVILLIIFLPKLFRYIKGDETESTTITTYTVEEVTYDSIDTTITGSSTLEPINTQTLTAPYSETEASSDTISEEISSESVQGSAQSVAYTVTELNAEAGEEVDEDDVIAVLEDEDGEETEIVAEFDGIVLEIAAEEDDEISSGSEIAIIMSLDGFEMSLSVDETEISTVEKGQEATVTVDALSEDFTGEVSAVSYNGSSNGSTAEYQITVEIEYQEGIYPAMSASAEIVIESSDEGLLVPVNAVNTSGDDSYIYIAPDSAESEDEYSEDELDLTSLTKVTVETGETDGTNILVTPEDEDDLEEGDLVIVITVTSTLTGSDSEETTDFGGMMGGGFGDGEMPDMSDFGGGDFDMTNIPQGGGQ